MIKELLTTHVTASRLVAFLVASIICLVQASTASAGGQPETGEITGVVWKWQQTPYNNDTKKVPPDPFQYSVEFKPDETLTIQAECNRAGGTYFIEGSRITIEKTHSTTVMCHQR